MCPLWYLCFTNCFIVVFVVLFMVESWLCAPIICVLGLFIACFQQILWRCSRMWLVLLISDEHSPVHSQVCMLLLSSCDDLLIVALCCLVTGVRPWIQVSTSLLSRCDDLLVVDEGCVVSFCTCVVLCCLVTGVHPWLHESIYFEYYLMSIDFCDGTKNFRRRLSSWASLLFNGLHLVFFSQTCVMDFPAWVAWRWLVTGFHPWLGLNHMDQFV